MFTREWQKGLDGYHSVKRLGGPGDHGRDVIGLCSPLGCEGVWDNYQCKNYEGSDDRTARVWHAHTGAELLQLKGHDGSVLGVAVTPDGSRIVTGSDDKTARVWDGKTGD